MSLVSVALNRMPVVALRAFALLILLGWAMPAQATEPGKAGKESDGKQATRAWRIELVDALGKGSDLHLLLKLRGNRVVHAFAEGPKYNHMPFRVDHRKLSVEGESLSGMVGVAIASDGHTPKRGQLIDARFDLTCPLRDGATGEFLGHMGRSKPSGKARVKAFAAQRDRQFRLTLAGENVVLHDRSKLGRGRRLGLVINFVNGKAVHAMASPPGNVTDAAYAGTVTKLNLSERGGHIEGELTVRLTLANRKQQDYEMNVDAQIIGDRVAGRADVRHGGKDAARGWVLGQVRYGDGPNAGNAVHTIVLNDAGPDAFMVLYLSSRDGRITHGFAATPNYNNTTHEVDVSKLKLHDGKLDGEVAVTVYPDPWAPSDRKPIDCRYALRVRIGDGFVAGRFSGRFGEDEVKGPVNGQLNRKPPAAPVAAAELHFEDALVADKPWQGRASISLQFRQGQFVNGRVTNQHTRLRGRVEKAALSVDQEQFQCALGVDIKGKHLVGGRYAFETRGMMVGNLCAGAYEGHHVESGKRKAGRFWGSVTREATTADESSVVDPSQP